MPPVPEVLGRMTELAREAAADRGGALWRLDHEGRQLDANLVRLLPGALVAFHIEPDLDVLLYVVEGAGELETPQGRQALGPGCLVWLPHGSGRALSATPSGLTYLTVHRRRPGMSIRSATARPEDVPRSAGVAGPEGGEAACLLNRVCTACGRLATERDARYCGRCGTALPSD